MKTNLCILACALFAPAAASLGGESVAVPLDKDFSFRLDTPALRPPPPEPAAPRLAPPVPQKTPEGERLPPGARAYPFNGQTYYLIPLGV